MKSEDILNAFKQGHFEAKKANLRALIVPAVEDDNFGALSAGLTWTHGNAMFQWFAVDFAFYSRFFIRANRPGVRIRYSRILQNVFILCLHSKSGA